MKKMISLLITLLGLIATLHVAVGQNNRNAAIAQGILRQSDVFMGVEYSPLKRAGSPAALILTGGLIHPRTGIFAQAAIGLPTDSSLVAFGELRMGAEFNLVAINNGNRGRDDAGLRFFLTPMIFVSTTAPTVDTTGVQWTPPSDFGSTIGGEIRGGIQGTARSGAGTFGRFQAGVSISRSFSRGPIAPALFLSVQVGRPAPLTR